MDVRYGVSIRNCSCIQRAIVSTRAPVSWVFFGTIWRGKDQALLDGPMIPWLSSRSVDEFAGTYIDEEVEML